MSTTEQKALELADRLDPDADSKNQSVICVADLIDAANHLRRLPAENEALRAQVEALTKNWRELGLERCEFDDACDFCEKPEGGIFTHLIHHAEDVTEADFYICVNCLHSAIKRHPTPSPLTRPAVPEGWDQIEQIATTRYKVTKSDSSMFHRHAVVAGDGERQLYLGREVECEIMARKFAGAFLDGAYLCQQMLAAAPQPEATIKESSRVAQPTEAAQPDPCPGCLPGSFCKKPTCGRLLAAQKGGA